jgi:hypothetical protein
VYTIHLLLVRGFAFFEHPDFANQAPATSGACATIASDALMNPFDGKITLTNFSDLR